MPTSTLDLWDISVVLVVMTRFDLWDALANIEGTVTPKRGGGELGNLKI